MSAPKLVKVSPADLKKKRAAAAAAQDNKPAKPKFGAKGAFILSQPSDRPAAEIVAEGAKRGLDFLPIYVHTVRLRARKAAGQPPKRRGRKPGSVVRNTGGTVKVVSPPRDASPEPRRTRKSADGAASSLESRFVSAVFDLGIARAEAILAGVRERVSSMHF